MLHLGYGICFPLRSIDHQKNRNGLLRLQKSTVAVRSAERDSDYEIEKDKAREALRKLDDQIQSLSSKPLNKPLREMRAVELEQPSISREKEDIPEIQGSLMSFAASSLIVLTVLYNILFLTVIKPAIDGPEPEAVQSADMVQRQRKLFEFPLGS